MAPSKSKSKGGGAGSKLKGGKKGPKGKRARAKAKLDRQWGEQPRKDADEGRHHDDTSATSSRQRHRERPRGRDSGGAPRAQGPRPGPAALSSSTRDRGEAHPSSRGPISERRRLRLEDGSDGDGDDDDDSTATSSTSTSDGDQSRDEDEEAPAATLLLRSLRDHHQQQRRSRRRRQGGNRRDEDESVEESSQDDDNDDDDSSSSGSGCVGGGATRDSVEEGGPADDELMDIVANEEDFFRERFVDNTEPVAADATIPSPDGAEASETLPVPSDPGLVVQAPSSLLNKLKVVRGRREGGGPATATAANTEVPNVAAQLLPSRTASLVHHHLPTPLRSSFLRWRQAANTTTKGTTAASVVPDPLLYPFLNLYADALVADDVGTVKRIARLATVALHLLSHVHKTQEVIRRNNHALYHRKPSRTEATDSDEDEEAVDDPPRDQGFTRPTVLVLLPSRSCCYQLVQLFRSLLAEAETSSSSKHQEANPAWERFEADYGPPPGTSDASEVADTPDDRAAVLKRRRQILRQKGPDWQELFGDDANDDDDFKLGIALHKSRAGNSNNNNNKGSDASHIKPFTDFYKSDIILASPLGLKILIENKDRAAEGDDDEEDDDNDDNDENPRDAGKSKSQRGYDFLSSIEICYLSRADVLLMQNWDHVCDVVRLLNEQPKCSTAIDFSRVRPYHLVAGQSQHWRQLIITSSFVDPMILSLFKLHAKSSAGSVRLRRKTLDVADADIARVLLPTRQVFQRVPTQSLAEHSSDRVRYFCDTVLPEVVRQRQKHTLVFLPSYFDFVSVRNVMLKRELDFVSVTEYSRVSEVSRGRARFLQGRKPILLYTGRAHFFHRHAIKGARHLIFVGVPEYADFYSGLVNMLGDGLDHQKNEGTSALEASSLVLLTKYDGHALERIVGLPNCSRMLRGDKSTFLF